MVVDRFGRAFLAGVSSSKTLGLTVPRGISLDARGNFDAEGKRITKLSNPTNATDAVNMQSTLLVKSNDDRIRVNKRRLVDLQEPIEDSDAATKGFVMESETRVKAVISDMAVKQMTLNKDFVESHVRARLDGKMQEVRRIMNHFEVVINGIQDGRFRLFEDALKELYPVIDAMVNNILHLFKVLGVEVTNENHMNIKNELYLLYNNVLNVSGEAEVRLQTFETVLNSFHPLLTVMIANITHLYAVLDLEVKKENKMVLKGVSDLSRRDVLSSKIDSLASTSHKHVSVAPAKSKRNDNKDGGSKKDATH